MATEKLFRRGFATAKLALQQFTFGPTKLSKIKFERSGDVQSPFYLITTTIEGDFSGSTEMIISDASAEILFKAHLPEGVQAEMKLGLLSELCNILVSAVITELVDDLGLDAYCQVPVAHHITESQDETLSDELLLVEGVFNSVETDLTVILHFLMEPKFVEHL